jgi:uncharacterized protein with HEPN domain
MKRNYALYVDDIVRSIDKCERYLNIPWSLMAKMRDKMIHWYFEIDEEIVWKVIQEQFPVLKIDIEKMKKRDNLKSIEVQRRVR